MARVLVVDDDSHCGVLLKLFLDDKGYDVRTAANGSSAVSIGSAFDPHLVITDWLLNDNLDGISVADILRRRNPDLGLILLTGWPLEQCRERLRCFPDAVLFQKPVDLDRLLYSLDCLSPRRMFRSA